MSEPSVISQNLVINITVMPWSSITPKIPLMKIIWKMNSLVVATTNSNLHSSMCNEKWIFHNDFSVFIHIEKSLKTFTSNSRKPELVEISQLPCVWIHCSLCMQECIWILHVQLPTDSGSVQTYVLFENRDFFSGFAYCPNTFGHWKCTFSKTLSRVKIFENASFLCTCWRTKTEVF